jgi:DNA-directed RNA polymerase specialized sigma24 family protein
LNEILELLFKKHKQWVDIVASFGCNIETAEDIVQEMYIKIQKKIENGTDILYNEDEINYYYIYLTLRTLFIDLKRKEKKVTIYNIEDLHKDIVDEEYIDYSRTLKSVLKELDKQFWYDKKVYEIIASGQSISELSRKTNISYYSLYNTYRKVKKKLKKLL